MSRFYVIFNRIRDDKDLGIMATTRPNIPCPLRKTKEVDITGHDGKLYEDLGFYEDMELTISYNYHSREEFYNISRKIKQWTSNIVDNKLQLSDDLEFFYLVKKVSCSQIERVFKTIGRFEVTFIVDPYIYLIEGEDEISITNNSTIYNEFDVSKPIYILTGEGNITLTINDCTAVINLGQDLTIDTDKRLTYRTSTKTWQNSKLSGYYEELYLAPGTNEISWEGGANVTLSIIPNWRTL